MGIKIGSVTQDLSGVNSEDAFYAKFTSATSESMAVNGSITPVEFSLESLPAGQMISLQMISFVIGSSDVVKLDQFGNVPSLANGIIFTSGDNSLEVKNNGDVALVATNTFFETTGTGVNSYAALNGVWDFTDSYGNGAPILVNADNLKIIIRDDLTAVPFFKVSCHGLLLDTN